MMICILDGGCIHNCYMREEKVCQATAQDIGERGLLRPNLLPSTLMTLNLDQVRSIARDAADAYRVIQELGGARHLRQVALNRCTEIMDLCENVTGVMDGRPDK